MDDPADQTARPYPHQVGGHGQLAMTKTGRILKPSSEKERDFYIYIYSQALPSELAWIRSVTPKYYGVTNFPNLSNTSTPIHSPSLPPPHPNAHPSPPFRPTAPPRSASTHALNSLHLAPSRCSDRPDASDTLPRATSVPEGVRMLWRHTSGSKQTSATISPWALQMGSRRQSASHPAKKPRLSIALEDINRVFSLPCVMDCKIGTRHYDDDASEEKRRRHIAKANATTSARCGVRYTGMQSFKRPKDSHDPRFAALHPDVSPGVFEFRDKYHGRTLKETDLVPEATWFFHDNIDVRTTCVKLILEKIRNLRRLLIEQHHFYFYSSSLLLVYEGALPHVAPARVDVRMIDFAHTVLSDGRRDDGYVHGIDYLIRILTQILENEETGNRILPTRHQPDPRLVAVAPTSDKDASDQSAQNGTSIDHKQQNPL